MTLKGLIYEPSYCSQISIDQEEDDDALLYSLGFECNQCFM